MDFAQSLEYLTDRDRVGIKLGLERIRAVMECLGQPQARTSGALVAGTNGKGSVCAMLSSILGHCGYRVGLMAKPHLVSYRERIQLDGRPIGEIDFAAAISGVVDCLNQVGHRLGPPTQFEILTAAGINFLAPRCDLLVCEVGMGGRLDSTNILDLNLAVITNVDLDHTQYLGRTRAAIAAEKAAIIKPGSFVVSGCRNPALAVVESAARRARGLWRLGSEVTFQTTNLGLDGLRLSVRGPGFSHSGLHIPLVGAHQGRNAALAVAAAEALRRDDFAISNDAIRSGLASVRWPGRLQLIATHPQVIVDGSHNVKGMASMAVAVDAALPDTRPRVAVFGAMADKDIGGMLRELGRLRPTSVIFSKVASERAATTAELAHAWSGTSLQVEPVGAAVELGRTLAGPDGVVVVCGSLYLVGEAMGALGATASLEL